MCQPASFIVTKDSVLWSTVSESHENIIAEFGFHMDGTKGPNGVRVEFAPADDLYWTDPATWAFKVDQDILPEWWDAEDAERRVKAATLKWQAAKIIKPDQKRDAIRDGDFVLYNYGTVEAIRGGTVQGIWGGTVQLICGGTVEAIWGGTVRSICGGTVQAIRGGTVQGIWGGTVQSICGGTVEAYEHVDPAILTGPHAVLIDRSGEFPVFHVGKKVAA